MDIILNNLKTIIPNLSTSSFHAQTPDPLISDLLIYFLSWLKFKVFKPGYNPVIYSTKMVLKKFKKKVI